MYRWMDRWIDRWMDGWMDGWMDRRMYGCIWAGGWVADWVPVRCSTCVCALDNDARRRTGAALFQSLVHFIRALQADHATGKKGGEWVYASHDPPRVEEVLERLHARCTSGAHCCVCACNTHVRVRVRVRVRVCSQVFVAVRGYEGLRVVVEPRLPAAQVRRWCSDLSRFCCTPSARGSKQRIVCWRRRGKPDSVNLAPHPAPPASL